MDVWRKLYPERRQTKPKLKIGDFVRVSKLKNIFQKGYTPNWSRELFIVSGINVKFVPIMYTITDFHGQEIIGKFYEQELQKIKKKDDVFRIEKVLKTRGKGDHKQYYVKWLGYPSHMNSWTNELLRNPTQ